MAFLVSFLFLQFWLLGLAKAAASELGGGICSLLVAFPNCSLLSRTSFLFTVLASPWLYKKALAPFSHLVPSVSIKKTSCIPLHCAGVQVLCTSRVWQAAQGLMSLPWGHHAAHWGGRCGERWSGLGRKTTTVPQSPWHSPKSSKSSPL